MDTADIAFEKLTNGETITREQAQAYLAVYGLTVEEWLSHGESLDVENLLSLTERVPEWRQ